MKLYKLAVSETTSVKCSGKTQAALLILLVVVDGEGDVKEKREVHCPLSSI